MSRKCPPPYYFQMCLSGAAGKKLPSILWQSLETTQGNVPASLLYLLPPLCSFVFKEQSFAFSQADNLLGEEGKLGRS